MLCCSRNLGQELKEIFKIKGHVGILMQLLKIFKIFLLF